MSKLSFEAVVMEGFKEIDQFFTSFFEDFTEMYDISSVQVKTIMEVKLNKAISMKDLCSKLNMSKSNLSPICKKLESANLLKKSRDIHDQRIVNLELTDKGEELLKALESRIAEKTQHIFGKLTEEDRSKVLEAMNIMVSAMKK